MLAAHKIRSIILTLWWRRGLIKPFSYKSFPCAERLVSRTDFLDRIWDQYLSGWAGEKKRSNTSYPESDFVKIVFCLSAVQTGVTKMHDKHFIWIAKTLLESLPDSRVYFFLTLEAQYAQAAYGAMSHNEVFDRRTESALALEREITRALPRELQVRTKFIGQNLKSSSLVDLYRGALQIVIDADPHLVCFFSGYPQDSPNIRRLTFSRFPTIVKLTQDAAKPPSSADGIWHMSGLPKRHLQGDQAEFFLRPPAEYADGAIRSDSCSSATIAPPGEFIGTILGGARIHKHLRGWSKDHWLLFQRFLQTHSIRWRFAGVSDPKSLEKLFYKNLSNSIVQRIEIEGPVDRFEAYLSRHLVLVNFPGLGGGGATAAAAVSIGIPVVCGEESDMARSVHKAFVGNISGYKLMYETISKLTQYTAFRSAWLEDQFSCTQESSPASYQTALRKFIYRILQK